MSHCNCSNCNNQQIEQYSNYNNYYQNYYDYDNQNNNIENFINANQKLTENYLAIQQQLLEKFVVDPNNKCASRTRKDCNDPNRKPKCVWKNARIEKETAKKIQAGCFSASK
jgi:hypothetical protein